MFQEGPNLDGHSDAWLQPQLLRILRQKEYKFAATHSGILIEMTLKKEKKKEREFITEFLEWCQGPTSYQL
jgi:hypothetical protein